MGRGSRVEKTGRGRKTGKDWVAGRKIRVKKEEQSVHSKSPPSLF